MGIHEYISESSPNAANRQVEMIVNAVDSLLAFPEKGRPGRRHGTRELVVRGTPYIAAYRVRRSIIRILAVVHGARRWPPILSN
jgi:plasmid stabilization system protein ParE